MVLPEESVLQKKKEIDWKNRDVANWVILFLTLIAFSVGFWNIQDKQYYQDLTLRDLNSSLQEIKQNQQAIAQGIGYSIGFDYNLALQLSQQIQDINNKVTINEQALQSLDYLSKNCTRSDENEYFWLRCKRQ